MSFSLKFSHTEISQHKIAPNLIISTFYYLSCVLKWHFCCLYTHWFLLEWTGDTIKKLPLSATILSSENRAEEWGSTVRTLLLWWWVTFLSGCPEQTGAHLHRCEAGQSQMWCCAAQETFYIPVALSHLLSPLPISVWAQPGLQAPSSVWIHVLSLCSWFLISSGSEQTLLQWGSQSPEIGKNSLWWLYPWYQLQYLELIISIFLFHSHSRLTPGLNLILFPGFVPLAITPCQHAGPWPGHHWGSCLILMSAWGVWF